MKREFIFRAKRVDNGQWVYGDLIANAATTFTYIIPDVGLKVDDQERGERIKILPETISQFTGLFDKKGNKIYENDIVKHDKGDVWAVEYFYFENNGYASMGFQCFVKSEWDKIEVIGNFFDNPELLTVEKTEHCQGICSANKKECFGYDHANGKCLTVKNFCEHRIFKY